MTTEEFFRLILPDAGRRVIAVMDPRTGDPSRRMRHKFLTNAADAAAFVSAADHAPVQIFHACAGYGEASGGRKGDNVVAVRSFWLDLDCGDGKPYSGPRDAVTALLDFTLALGLPAPTMVASGGGVHGYWPLTADIDPASWRVLATMLKEACKRHGLHADPARTADIASVLRPPGATHRKGADRAVKLLTSYGQSPLASFQGPLEAYLGVEARPEPDDSLGDMPSHLAVLPQTNTDLGEREPFRPASAARAANECGVLGLMRDTGGQVDQPTWYHALQVINRCDDGQGLAHEWSKDDPRYTAQEVDRVLGRLAGVGPTLCSKLAEYQPAICGSCRHHGKISSPIVLGVEPPAVAPVLIKTTTSVFGSSAGEPAPLELPYGFQWRPSARHSPVNALCRYVPGDKEMDYDDPEAWKPFCRTLFYPVERLDSHARGASIEIEMHQRGDIIKRFTLPSSLVAKGGAELSAALGAHEIMAESGQKPTLETYLSNWVVKMSKERDAIIARTKFGWDGSAFVVGHNVLKPGGIETGSVLEGITEIKADALTPRGSLDEWVRIIDTAYNAPNQEAFQFMLLLGFAAPLFALLKEFGGITVHAHSEGTGVGKTTAQRAALSAWGNYQDLQLADGKTTSNALWALMGAYGNLPVLLDELTNQSNAVASEIVFSVSSGRTKERLTASADLRPGVRWQTILMTSGNMLLSDKLAQHRGNAEAELARLFEFTVDSHSHLSPNEATTLFPGLLDNYGHAGRAFIRYVVDNYDKVSLAIESARIVLNNDAGIDQGERFWSALFASVLTAHRICTTQGLLRFPVAPLRGWMMQQLARNRISRASNISDPVTLFGEMLTDIWPGILITRGEGDLRKQGGAAQLIGNEPRGQLTGRAMIQGGLPQSLLLISVSAIRQWCNRKAVSSTAMLDALVAKGFASPTVRSFSLGKGTENYSTVSSQVRCWEIFPDAMGVDFQRADTSTGSNVLSITSHGRAKVNGHRPD